MAMDMLAAFDIDTGMADDKPKFEHVLARRNVIERQLMALGDIGLKHKRRLSVDVNHRTSRQLLNRNHHMVSVMNAHISDQGMITLTQLAASGFNVVWHSFQTLRPSLPQGR